MICCRHTVLGTDEPDHAVDQQRSECASHGVGARLDGLLIHAVMRIGGQRTALAGLEVHHVVADRAAPQRYAASVPRASTQGHAGVAWPPRCRRSTEIQIDRRAALDRAQAGGDVCQHAGLCRNGVTLDARVEHGEQRARGIDAVSRRVDPDHRIARAKQQAVERGCATPRGSSVGWLGCRRTREARAIRSCCGST